MMLNNILKVFDEDLAKGSLAGTSISSYKAIEAGSTQGGLCVNVFAVGDVSIAEDVSVSITHGDSENGSFSELHTIAIEATASFKDGELMATYTLPQDVKNYVTASVGSGATNSGSIRVTLGYLAR